MYRYGMLLRHDLGKILDTFYWPLIDIFSWGFLTVYINQSRLTQNGFAMTLLSGLILWTVVYMLGRDIAISFLDDMWDRNILNLYGSPMRPGEFLIASLMIAIIRVVIAIAVLSLVAYLVYGFNILILGWGMAIYFLVLTIFSYAVGIFAVTLVLRFGQGVEIFAWSIPAILSPLSAVFYPLSVLPKFVQSIALLLPTTYIFEGMRGVLLQGEFNVTGVVVSLLLTSIYLFAAILLFFHVFYYVRKTGLIARFS